MIEFILRGSELGGLEALGMAYGLSITFRRALVVGEMKREWLDVITTLGVWGAFLISPCPSGLPCLNDLEKAVALSEARQMPVGYSGELPQTRQHRTSTFNRNYLRPRRWILCRGEDKKYLSLFACIYNLLKLRHDVPIVVSDICIDSTIEERPDFQVLPTRIMPRTLADVVDIAAPPIPSTSIAKGILLGGYKAGPVIAISTRDDPQLVEMGGYLVNLGTSGNPCEVFERGSVGYDPALFSGDLAVEPELCDKCGDCFMADCGALSMAEGGVPKILDVCVKCGACVLLCTRGAIRRIKDTFKVYLK